MGTNARNLELSAAFFENCGYEVSSEAIRQNGSDLSVDVSASLVLVDADVFSDSLREVYRRFCEEDVPVVLLLGTVTPNARECAARDGVTDIHEKPLRKRELRSLVDSQVNGVPT
ncbi:hypothetical protein [Haloprofundus marisrubri]|uniref:hypothetical protein n=1 Tax=Haloprofundus marisrubri TaxID=1514971 RepID=UPI0012BB0F6E|nr:hypothetical protein [Haloprofundus marisrubri]